ncbi:MAG TPA: hypothetical protein V6C76_08970 [Drouetiella sp.]
MIEYGPLFVRKVTKKYFALLALLLPACFALSTSATAYEMVPFSDDWFNRQFDWVLQMNLNPMDKYLKYKGSQMTPILRVPISLRFTPRLQQRKDYNYNRRQYEELWYHDGKAVGLKRYNQLNLGMDEQGAIWIQPDAKMGESMREVTNALVRLVLDVYACKTVLATIVVPKDYFELFASSLAQYNFFKLSVVYPGGPGNNMSIHLVSQPFGTERYFYYDDSGRR